MVGGEGSAFDRGAKRLRGAEWELSVREEGSGAVQALLSRLEAAAKRVPSCTIADAGGTRVSLGTLVDDALLVSRALRARGMQGGDRALFSIRPSVAAVTAILAIEDAGGAIVPMDPRMGHALFRTRLELLEPKWVFAESMLYAASGWLAPLLRWRGIRVAPFGAVRGATLVRSGGRLPGSGGTVSLEQLARAGRAAREGRAGRAGRARREERVHTNTASPAGSAPNEHADAFIVFTSGTTGTPKGVVHTHASLGAILACIEREVAFHSEDVLYARDLHLIMPALLAGASVVIPRSVAFDAVETLRDIERCGVTRMFSVTSDCMALVDELQRRGDKIPATLREILIGGAPAHTSFLERLQTVLRPSTKVWCIYGMTEILPVARVSLEEKLAFHGAEDFVGSLVPGVEGRVAADGELLLRGDALFDRYLGHERITEHATGDLAELRDGKLSLLGRRKDMIIRGDFNLYPELYEPVVERIPGVRRAAFVGVYDERRADEVVVLVIESAPGVNGEALRTQVERALRAGDTRIDESALPDVIAIMPLPLSGRSSKVDKTALRQLVNEQLWSEASPIVRQRR